VFVALNSWIEGVPNGSIISCPAGGIYQLSQGVMLGNRQHLDFRLGTCEFRLTGVGSQHTSSAFIPGYRRNFGFVGGASNLRFEGGVVRGNDTCPGCPQPLRGENQQAVRCNGSNFIEVTGMQVHAVSGDHTFWDNCNDIWVHHNHVFTAGRNGLTVIKGQRVLGEDNAFDDVGYATFDLEPNTQFESSADITFRRNTGADWQNGIGFVSVDGAGMGADIRRLRIEGNTATGTRALQIYVDNKDGVNGNPLGRMTDVRVIDNHGPAGGVLRFQNIDGLVVQRNDGSVSITDCTGVVQ
jgi:hypothetical protein